MLQLVVLWIKVRLLGGIKMKIMKKVGLALTLSATLAISTFIPNADAATQYQVKTGDSYYKVAKKYGVKAIDLMKANNSTSSLIYPGQTLVVPTPNSEISTVDKDLMARLVHAEAKGEPYAGKVAVAYVILNRVASPKFPNKVKEVIYQKDNGYYQFSPVANGEINKPADAESVKAVNEALLADRSKGAGSLFFYNPKTATARWLDSLPTTITIGNHVFKK